MGFRPTFRPESGLHAEIWNKKKEWSSVPGMDFGVKAEVWPSERTQEFSIKIGRDMDLSTNRRLQHEVLSSLQSVEFSRYVL